MALQNLHPRFKSGRRLQYFLVYSGHMGDCEIAGLIDRTAVARRVLDIAWRDTVGQLRARNKNPHRHEALLFVAALE
jgi:hypothetical protein